MCAAWHKGGACRRSRSGAPSPAEMRIACPRMCGFCLAAWSSALARSSPCGHPQLQVPTACAGPKREPSPPVRQKRPLRRSGAFPKSLTLLPSASQAPATTDACRRCRRRRAAGATTTARPYLRATSPRSSSGCFATSRSFLPWRSRPTRTWRSMARVGALDSQRLTAADAATHHSRSLAACSGLRAAL